MSDEIMGRIADWCAAEHDLEVEGHVVSMAGDPPLDIGVDIGDEQIVLHHEHTTVDPPPGYVDTARGLLSNRSSMVTGEVALGERGTAVRIRYPIYIDGFTRQGFIQALRDIAGTVDALDTALRSGGETSRPEPAAVEAVEEQPTMVMEPAADAQPAAEEQPAAADAVWAPTHAVPSGGMAAWAQPDPSQNPVANLAERVELRLDEELGAWAKVTGSNGWTGWVDGRRLQPIGATPSRRPATRRGVASGTTLPGDLALRPLPLIGGIVLIIASFVPWLSGGPKTFDWPLAVLWRSFSPDHPRLGLVLLLLGIAALALSVIAKAPSGAFVLIGLLAAACPVIYFIQVLTSGASFGDVMSALGAGFWMALAGGVGTTIAGRIG